MKAHVSLMLMASQAMASFYNSSLIAGGPYNSDPTFEESRSDEIYREAITNPKATRSIKFTPFSDISYPSNRGDREWTWRVNVTDFAFPPAINVTDIKGNPITIDSPHHVSTTYDFQWSGGGNISDALGTTTEPFCVTAPDIKVYPANVTDLYSEENADSTDCTPVLGEDCVRAILTKGNNLSFEDKCNGIKSIWTSFPECSSTLKYASEANLGRQLFGSYGGFGLVTINIVPDGTNARNTTAERNRTLGITSGEGFLGFHSGVIPGSNATERYLAAANRVQILMISHAFRDASVGDTELLCMRVNTTRLSEGEPSSGVRYGPGAPWTMLAVILTGLALLL
ncbi:uncharacterized protein CTRU02_213080 [Colletotrichum truncatum]|uniref:Uncharacterized protein n=1 Tax=Colletotrichum truncatum TaxID=5467 RepID=A0ACC3YJU4_COLTU|nr:uncharacterized protein CTRU02_03402 [Colletotrichum truncatum]KAF6797371.1 hypothetical protein CTRU02_03402 [Colletotrichum truncatum]